MTGSVRKVYSEAMFELAAEQNCAAEVFGELEELKRLWEENPGFSKVLDAPTISLEEKLGIAEKAFKGRVSETVYNFICVLTEKGRAGALPEIADSYKEKWFDFSGIAEVTVTTSEPLTDALREKLLNKLKTVYKKEIRLEEKVDPSLMGGMVVKYGNTMLDGSVRTRMDNIQKQIKNIIA